SGVLIYFIHHIAKLIQLPQVIASIAGDLSFAIDTEVAPGGSPGDNEAGPSLAELTQRLDESGATIVAAKSGYLQFVAYGTLVDIAADADAVIRLLYRPGHFVTEGLPL